MRIPGATKFSFSFSRLCLTMFTGFVETAFSASGSVSPNSEVSMAVSFGLRIVRGSLVPLETIMGRWNSSAIDISRLRVDRNLTR